MRFNVIDQLGIIRQIGELCERHHVSIFSILQTPIADMANIPFVVTTEDTTLAAVTALCDEVSKLPWCVCKPMIMPILQ